MLVTKRQISMFSTVNLAFDDSGPIALVLVDGPTNGKTIRRSMDRTLEHSIAHQSSNENPGFATQRTNVRVTETIAVPESDKTVKAYAQLTMSIPTNEMDQPTTQKLVARLINFLVLGEAGTGTEIIYDDLSVVARLYAGEP